MNTHYQPTLGVMKQAIRILAVHPGSIKERLLAVHKTIFPLTTAEFPLELQSDWCWVKSQLTKYDPLIDQYGNMISSSVEVTLHSIKNTTGEKIAGRIYDICWSLENDNYH